MSDFHANELIEASAGTGKTQALGERLVTLLERGVKPHEIAALTFSRAAAGEIFERFVMLLAEKAETDHAAAQCLRDVLATQHLSQIGTLDSFLMRVVSAFPLELGLTGRIALMDDYEAAQRRNRVSFGILRRTDAQTKKAFAEAFALANNGEDVRSFVESYRAFISTWHERVTEMPDPRAWGDPQRIWDEDVPLALATESDLAAAADAVLETFKADDKWRAFADWVRGFRGAIGTLGGYAAKILAADTLFEGVTFSFRYGNRKNPIELDIRETAVVRAAVWAVYGYAVRKNLELARGVHYLVSAYERDYAAKVRQRGAIVFADIPRLLKALPWPTRLALEYRLDARIRAWALDEFQDTSRPQWQVLENLLDEAKQSDGETSVFVVGDTKQAIYGWRAGDVRIFEGERTGGLYHVGELKKTWRSGAAIVEAVNRIFARGRILSEFPDWKCPEHETAHPDRIGFVRVMDAPDRRKESFVEPVYQSLVAVLGAKQDDPRRCNVTAAILVRDNSLGEHIADGLKRLGFEGVVWEGERNILDTPALAPFLDLVQLSEHPGDAFTYRHFKMTPLAALKYPDGVPTPEKISDEMSALFTTRGLVRTLRELRALLPSEPERAWSVFTEERFTDMLRVAADFERTRTADTRLSDFAGYLAAQQKRTVAEAGKVKVMTIHRSKGLSFDYVIVPLYEHEALTNASDKPLVGKDWILPRLDGLFARNIPKLAEAYRLCKNRDELEALCIYYVALTRAKYGMTLVLTPPAQTQKNDATVRFSDIVRNANLADLTNKDEVIPGGTRSVASAGGTRSVASASPSARVASAPLRGKRRTVRRRLPSMAFPPGMSAGALFLGATGRAAALAHGTAAHAAMEDVEFSETLPKPEGFVALWRECAFEVFAQGEWISGRFDRVTFYRKDGELCADIIDFKTSLAHPERYDAQLAVYKSALVALTGIPEVRITARLMKI